MLTKTKSQNAVQRSTEDTIRSKWDAHPTIYPRTRYIRPSMKRDLGEYPEDAREEKKLYEPRLPTSTGSHRKGP